MRAYVEVDPCDVLDELSDTVLLRELESRKIAGADPDELKALAEKVWIEMRGKDAPQSLRDFLWEFIGKVL